MSPRNSLTCKATLLFVLAGGALLANCAWGQSLCDLLPVSAVKLALGMTGDPTAKPNTHGSARVGS
jgi:hypothetical protein